MDLFPGEKLDFATDENGSLYGLLSDEAINKKYSMGEVRIVTEQARYPLVTIVSMLESGQYDLTPVFQRRRRWNDATRSRLIESFIMNVPVPPVFLYEDDYSHFEVMDGLQRFTAIRDFYQNKYKLCDLQKWPELNGRTYSQLPEQIKRGIDRRYLSSIILLRETAKDSETAQMLKLLVFERINSGGVKLEYQESRNAIYNGSLNRLCIELSRNKYFCRTWGIPEPDEKELKTNHKDVSASVRDNPLYMDMTDVEHVLRFFAYRQKWIQQGALKDFLDEYLRLGNDFPKEVLSNLGDLFTQTIELVYQVFGKKAFWLWRERKGGGKWFARPTIVVYDPLMYVFSHHLNDKDKILVCANDFRQKIEEFYKKNYDRFEGRNVNLSDLIIRNELFEEFYQNIIG